MQETCGLDNCSILNTSQTLQLDQSPILRRNLTSAFVVHIYLSGDTPSQQMSLFCEYRFFGLAWHLFWCFEISHFFGIGWSRQEQLRMTFEGVRFRSNFAMTVKDRICL